MNHASDHAVAQSRDIRWALNYAIDRAAAVEMAEHGAGQLAFHPFTPYAWFAPYETRLQQFYDRYSLDATQHLDLVDERMAAAGYTRNANGMWERDGETVDMSIYASSFMSRYGVHIIQQLQDAGFNASLDRTSGGGAVFGRGERDFRLGCKGPSGVYWARTLTTCSRCTRRRRSDRSAKLPLTHGRPRAIAIPNLMLSWRR